MVGHDHDLCCSYRKAIRKKNQQFIMKEDLSTKTGGAKRKDLLVLAAYRKKTMHGNFFSPDILRVELVL